MTVGGKSAVPKSDAKVRRGKDSSKKEVHTPTLADDASSLGVRLFGQENQVLDYVAIFF